MSEERKQIKIAFCDFFEQYKAESNMFINILKERYDVTLSDDPDFLFYSCFGTKYKSYHNCIKIFYTHEAVTPNFNECDYAIGFDYIEFGDRYIRRNRQSSVNIEQKQNAPISMANRKFCNFIFSNAASGEGSALRQDFCKKLMEYKHIDCPGKVLNNMQNAIEPRNGDWAKGKMEFISQYKFTIAFENCEMDGYTTEKLTQPLNARSIPIYWGNPLVARDFNPKAFINCYDFNSFDEVIEYIKYLDNNDDAYMAMLREPPMQANYKPSNIQAFLYNIIEKGNKPYGKNPRKFRMAAIEDVPLFHNGKPKYGISFWISIKNLITLYWIRRKIYILFTEKKFAEAEKLAYSLVLNNMYLEIGHKLLRKIQTEIEQSGQSDTSEAK